MQQKDISKRKKTEIKVVKTMSDAEYYDCRKKKTFKRISFLFF